MTNDMNEDAPVEPGRHASDETGGLSLADTYGRHHSEHPTFLGSHAVSVDELLERLAHEKSRLVTELMREVIAGPRPDDSTRVLEGFGRGAGVFDVDATLVVPPAVDEALARMGFTPTTAIARAAVPKLSHWTRLRAELTCWRLEIASWLGFGR